MPRRPANVLRRIGSLLVVVVLAAGLTARFPSTPRARATTQNMSRFAALTFGPRGGAAALANSPNVPAEQRLPNGWMLRPAGTQIETPRAPTGVTASPDGTAVAAINSALFDNQIVMVNGSTLTDTRTPATDLFMGVVIDDAGNMWASTGNRNRVYQYVVTPGPKAQGTRQRDRLDPTPPYEGIPVVGYPGNMALGSDGRLYVVGNLSVPQSFITSTDATAGPCPNGAPADRPFCSVVNVLDVSDPMAPSIPDHLVPVGRDAYDIAFNKAAQKLYVSNWADETNPARAGGTGTVSVVDVSQKGKEHEVQVVPVGHHPTGLAISPDGSEVVVANAADDTITVLPLAGDGTVATARTISMRTNRGAPRAATPLDVSFAPDGSLLFIILAGQNAVEVRRPNGDPISQDLVVPAGKGTRRVHVPHTYIPTGWYPSSIAVGPNPDNDDSRIYVTNLKGMGSGPGENGQAEPLVGERTEGTLSVIDLPKDPEGRAAALKGWTLQTVENNDWLSLFDGSASAAKNPCHRAPMPGGTTTFSPLLCRAWRGKIDRRQLHVVYVVKENKTFDQYFGDINATGVPDADADPSWLVYGEDTTTNQHRLAATYTLSDDFWADSEQSTTGHSWTSAGYVTEYNELTWNPEYAEGVRGKRWSGVYAYDGPQAQDCAQPTDGCDPEIGQQEGQLFQPRKRFVDILANPRSNPQHLTFRVYSDDVNAGTPAMSRQVPLALWGIGPSAVHHGRDLDFPDTDRVGILLHGHTVSNAWSGCDLAVVVCKGPPEPPPPSYHKEIGLCGAPDAKDLEDAPDTFCKRDGARHDEYRKYALDAWTKKYKACRKHHHRDRVCQRAMPNFLYVALPVDHTLGFNPDMPSPASMVANNDLAVGQLVEALSRSPFWRNTLVMITEDDTQLAGDHVDAHRTFLLTVGGLARRWGSKGKASHQPGSFPSILKTVEALFHLPPLTIFDRAAVPLHDVVVKRFSKRRATPYQAVEPQTRFTRNPSTGILARISMALDWNGVDRVNTDVLNDLFYHHFYGWPLRPRDFGVLRGEVSGSGVDDDG